MHAISRIHIIVNPASGGNRPVLRMLNNAFHPLGIEWDVFVTKAAGDARRYAEAALAAQVDAVGVYGGDGTIVEAASVLAGQDTPLAIFPGGTANVLSVEMGIPRDPAQACALISDATAAIRAIDVGQMGEHVFLIRVGLGLEADVIEATDRGQKDRVGWFAYALNTLRQMADPQVSHYKLTIDGREAATDGLMCVIANSGILSPNAAVPGSGPLRLAPNIAVEDGLLDVLVIRRGDPASLLSVAASVVAGNEDAEPLLHWQGQEITVTVEPRQAVQLDGDIVGQSPVTAKVLPQALRVIVPGDAAAFQSAGRSEAGASHEEDAAAGAAEAESPVLPHVRPPV